MVAVEVKNEGQNTRWYSGSGIYRHVWLTVVNPVHIDIWGICITTPRVSEISSDVRIVSTINNKGHKEQKAKLLVRLIDGEGNVAGSSKNNITLSCNGKTDAELIIPVENPELWSPETPAVYTAEVTVAQKKRTS